jgi:hypothetical protein
LHKNKLYK